MGGCNESLSARKVQRVTGLPTRGDMLAYEQWLAEMGRNLQRHRLFRGLTQAASAELCGLDLKYYQDVEYGRRPVTTRTLYRIAESMGIDVAELVPPSSAPARRGRRSVDARAGRKRGADGGQGNSASVSRQNPKSAK